MAFVFNISIENLPKVKTPLWQLSTKCLHSPTKYYLDSAGFWYFIWYDSQTQLVWGYKTESRDQSIYAAFPLVHFEISLCMQHFHWSVSRSVYICIISIGQYWDQSMYASFPLVNFMIVHTFSQLVTWLSPFHDFSYSLFLYQYINKIKSPKSYRNFM